MIFVRVGFAARLFSLLAGQLMRKYGYSSPLSSHLLDFSRFWGSDGDCSVWLRLSMWGEPSTPSCILKVAGHRMHLHRVRSL